MLREILLKRIQSHIPIVSEPFKVLAEEIGVSEKTLLEEIYRLKEEGFIRQISPIYNASAIGYDSALVAFKVNPKHLEEVALKVNLHPGVSHNYERTHTFNLWFTLAVPPDSPLSLEETVHLMADSCNVKEFVILKTVRAFKLKVKLDYSRVEERENNSFLSVSVRRFLSEEEKEIVKKTQKDIPLRAKPFALLAKEIGISENLLLEKLNDFYKEGVIRRFSAILHHRKIGFKANGMAVWKVPPERVEEIGKFFASFKSVSHCYERTTSPLWQYNLFTMIHGRTKEEVISFVERVGEELNIKDYAVLFSTREFKKKRIELFSEEFYERKGKQVGVYTHKGENFPRSFKAVFPKGV